jgi:hypothetical protein
MPIGDVLHELSETTHVEIFTNRPPENRMLTKTYTDMSLARIIRDLFKEVSFALVWYYAEEGLEGIGVWFFHGDKEGATGRLRNVEDRATVSRRVPFQRQSMPADFNGEDPGADADAGIDTEADTGENTDVFEEDAVGDREPGETELAEAGLETGEEGDPQAESLEGGEQ